MPVRLSLHLVADGAAVHHWGPVSRPARHLILYLLHVEAVFVADLLVQGGGRRASARNFDRSALGALLLVSGALLVRVLRSPIGHRLSRAARVVLRGRQVHLVLLGTAGLDHTGWLPDNLLVGQGVALDGATGCAELRVIRQPQIELRGIELDDIGDSAEFLRAQIVRLLLVPDDVRRL